MYRRNIPLLFLVVSVCLSTAAMTFAQTTVMNVPSTAVVPAKKVYAEMDFISNFAWHDHGAFENYTPRAIVGVAKGVEAGVNVSFTHVNGGPSQPVEVQPNIKWQFYANEQAGTAMAIGCILYAPVTQRVGTDTLAQCYEVASKQFHGRFGPRFSGGGFLLFGASDNQRTKGGAIAGYEQPLVKRVQFIVDWFSGDNRFGYVSPGFSLATSKNSALTAGYGIANHGRGRNALLLYYGKQF